MRRGEVYRVALDPVIGSETGKTRPAVVVQNDLANRSSPTVTIVPISSRVAKVYPTFPEAVLEDEPAGSSVD